MQRQLRAHARAGQAGEGLLIDGDRDLERDRRRGAGRMVGIVFGGLRGLVAALLMVPIGLLLLPQVSWPTAGLSCAPAATNSATSARC